MGHIDPWVIWSVLAVVLIVAEILVSGFVLLFFGIGAIPAAVAAYFVPHSPSVQIIVFIITSGVALAFGRKIAMRLTAGAPSNVGADRMLGKAGFVLKEIDPSKASGLVRVDREEWRAVSETGEIIPADVWVEVIRIDGTHLVVIRKPENREA